MIKTARFFKDYFKRAKVNCFVIMDVEGTVIKVSKSFTNNFGYNTTDMKGKNFSMLFTEADNKRNKPETELKATLDTGQSNDENYLVNKSGKPLWCTGESVLVDTGEGVSYIVKDVVNLQSKKQLQMLLSDSDERLENFYDAPIQIPVMVLDGSLKIKMINNAFLELFKITKPSEEDSPLSALNDSFWSTPQIKSELRESLVNREPIRQREFLLNTTTGARRKLYFNASISESKGVTKMYIMVMDEFE